MHKGRPFSISIDEFIRTGYFGSVKPGMMIDEVKRIFPKPDSVNPMGDGISIWLYDRLEFHFFDNELSLIWCDWLDGLKSPQKKQFKLDKGILKGPQDIIHITKILRLWKIYPEITGYYSGEELESIIYDFNPIVMYFQKYEDSRIQKWELNAIGAKSSNFIHNYTAPFYQKLEPDFIFNQENIYIRKI